MMSKKAYHHGNLREALIEAAEEILSRNGVEGLSLRKVAQQAGVSATALYSHFKDKRELLAELATKGFDLLTAFMEREINDADDTGEEHLLGLARGYVYFATENAALFQLMFGPELSDLLAFPALAEASSKSYAMMADAVARQMATNGAAISPAVGTAAAWSLVHGLATLINDGRITASDSGVDSTEALINQVGSMLNFSR